MVNRQVVVHAMRCGNLFTEQINITLQPFDLTIQQFNVLRILRGRNGSAASLESVTQDMIHRMSNTSRLVDKLIDKGLVNRKVCSDNRRKVDIFITDKGIDLLKKIDHTLNNTEMELTSKLTKKELEQLLVLLKKTIT